VRSRQAGQAKRCVLDSELPEEGHQQRRSRIVFAQVASVGLRRHPLLERELLQVVDELGDVQAVPRSLDVVDLGSDGGDGDAAFVVVLSSGEEPDGSRLPLSGWKNRGVSSSDCASGAPPRAGGTAAG